jgi:acetylornithine deacetylase/succinyl-diaminopimelate desuccinylase-like protein
MRRAYTQFERRIRAAARLSLYGSLVFLGVAAWVGSRVLQPAFVISDPWLGVDYGALPEVQLLQEFVGIDTSYPTGSELAGAEFLARKLAAAGIPVTIERFGTNQANLWAILEGTDPAALVLHQHIDTDPVPDPENWKYSPWSGKIAGPWIHGRGVFDMKSVGIAHLVAMLELKKAGLPLQRSVILLATGSEERGSDIGVKWILREHPELAARFWGVLTEGGVVEARASDELKYWGTEVAQRRQVEVTMCSPSRERLEALRQDLVEHGRSARLELPPVAAEYLSAYGPSREAPALRLRLTDPQALVRTPNVLDELPFPLHGVVSSRCHPYPTEPHPGGGFQVKAQCLLLPGTEFAAQSEALLPAWLRHGLPFTVREVSPPAAPSPLDHPLYLGLQEALRRRFREGDRGPWIQGAGSVTDARFFRAARIPTYGFSPFPFLITDTMRIGDLDEQVSVKAFVAGVELMRLLVEELAL